MDESLTLVLSLSFWGVIIFFFVRTIVRAIKRAITKEEDIEIQERERENEKKHREYIEQRNREYIEQRKKPISQIIDTYRDYTQQRNWSGIFYLNNNEISALGTKKELEVLANYLEDGEVVFAIVSGIMSQSATSNEFDFGLNTWVAVLTSERVLCLDHALFSESVDTQSIRLNRIQAVSASQGWKFGKVVIDIGNRMIKVDNCVKAHVSVFADLANKLLKEQETFQVQEVNKGSNLVNDLERLKKLKEAGTLSEEEFVLAKQKIMNV